MECRRVKGETGSLHSYSFICSAGVTHRKRDSVWGLRSIEIAKIPIGVNETKR